MPARSEAGSDTATREAAAASSSTPALGLRIRCHQDTRPWATLGDLEARGVRGAGPDARTASSGKGGTTAVVLDGAELGRNNQELPGSVLASGVVALEAWLLVEAPLPASRGDSESSTLRDREGRRPRLFAGGEEGGRGFKDSVATGQCAAISAPSVLDTYLPCASAPNRTNSHGGATGSRSAIAAASQSGTVSKTASRVGKRAGLLIAQGIPAVLPYATVAAVAGSGRGGGRGTVSMLKAVSSSEAKRQPTSCRKLL
eukprot:gnl/TRDRNA2_/TRDRNA2_133832_c0_seq2.p1 gnl/TRDRNA2_/TRDRNA2_133832_c0~~gnl/TRDRNA2_/TRDRNA2_133832_c0_seq2.p1  ORF type:complete len:258 (+),score=21.87 gnl/TRDRNA2_/TRDRNA2_133832_c0_seq2:492-1265(+)